MKELNIKVTKTPKNKNNEVELFVETSKDVANKAYSIALRDASNNIDIPGFRKGKAPKDIVENNVGISQISRKAFESIFYDLLFEAAKNEKIDIVDVVEITSFELLPEKPLTFKTIVELKPEVNLGKYRDLKVKAKKTVYEKDLFIKKTLEKLANNLIEFKKVNDRIVREGDCVLLDFDGKYEDGTEVPGGKAENFQALLEKDKFLPEFVDKLQGTSIGEIKEIFVTFPDNYGAGLSSKKAVFKVKVNGIEEKVIPPINDDLAKKLGVENLEVLKQKIETQMIQLQDLNSQSDFENNTVNQIIQNSKFEVSERMIEKEMDYLLNDVKMQCDKNGIKWNEFKGDLKNKELIERAKEAAIKRISIDLVLGAIVKKENISTTPEEIDKEVKTRVLQLGDKYKHLEADTKFRNTVEMIILRNNAVDFLIKGNHALWEKEVSKVMPE